jgi:amino acid transporter
MSIGKRVKKIIFGNPLNPFNPQILRHISLVAFLAWVGLGADGLSSSCYGPEEAYIALGTHTHFALYIAIATAITVFVISIGYNQVIELFPSGGGGYKVASQLLSPYLGSFQVQHSLSITFLLSLFQRRVEWMRFLACCPKHS